MKNTCVIEKCFKPAKNRGWCAMHYARWKKHGDTSVVKKAANGDGYMALGYAGHQVDGIRKFDHVRIAEAALGRTLPKGAVVHHVDEDRSNNRNDNLVICPDRKYHNFLHMRIDAMKACGNANWRKCRYCHKYDEPSKLRVYISKTGATAAWHVLCSRAHADRVRADKKRIAA